MCGDLTFASWSVRREPDGTWTAVSEGDVMWTDFASEELAWEYIRDFEYGQL
jgi:hypothetical protein